SIDVSVPVRTAYNQWTQFEDFPRFMTGVKSVQQLDAVRLVWVAEIGGKDVEWTANITHQDPDHHIGWRSSSGAKNAGSVTFTAVSPAVTHVTLRLDFEPDGALEKTGSALGLVERRVKTDLENFKEFIESRGQETGSWRGAIRQSQVVHERTHQTGAGGSGEPGSPGDTGPTGGVSRAIGM
ncbi:MAG TPA: SRPBCC family protein, partial [Planctomycetota bacterium]|nr:SRPBCC family protein [Planctomycetota bacterium]